VRRRCPTAARLAPALAGLVLLFAPAVAGCGKSGAARLAGHWRGTKVEGVTPDQQQAANDFALQTEILATPDAISVTTPGKGKITSRFKVVREDKKSLVIVTDSDGPKDEQTFTFDDERSMKWRVVEGKLMTFEREVAAK